MVKTKAIGNAKKKLAYTAVVIGAVMSLLTLLFIQQVKDQLWNQSINTILEATRQGCNTLKVQLNHDFKTMDSACSSIKDFSLEDREQLERLILGYSQMGNSTRLYLSDGASIPDLERDEAVEQAFKDNPRENGFIDPHISSVTGVNVFNLFVKVVMADGTEGYLVKEYEVGSIVDNFSLSFYEDAGFSYVVNTKGDVLIRPPHPNSNKTVKNLFDMLPVTENSQKGLARFSQALEQSYTGWAVFNYEDRPTVFCYTPLQLQSDWFLISIIPEDVVNAQTNEILFRAAALIAIIILGISVLIAVYIRYVEKTARKLQNQADYIEHLYNAIPEAIALVSAAPLYQFLQLNQEGLCLLGYPPETPNDAPKGKTLKDMVHPEDYSDMVRLFQTASLSGQKKILENRLQREDSSYFWVSGIIEKTMDDSGNPVLIAAFHDITKEKLAKEAAEREKLQERMTLVGAISNAYPVIIQINLTKDILNFVYIKPGLMIGLGTQTSYSQLFDDMASTVHPDNQEDFYARFSPDHLRKVLGLEKKEVFLEGRQMLTDQNYHWTSTQIIYVDNPYSSDMLAVLISRRIDEQRYEEDRQRQALQTALENARAASEAKGQFLSNMSHDIRTPMNAIMGMTAIAKAHIKDTDRVKECLGKISLSSSHLLSLINEVLDMSKIESGKLSLKEEPFNYPELVLNTVELIRSQAAEKALKLKVKIAVIKSENVIGDALRIQQIFLNILSNAVKYTPAGGSIEVEMKQENSARMGYQNYVFSCSDNGAGMSQQFLDRIFEPFERAQDTTTSKITGTGLGMAITKNLVDLMNGDIVVESIPDKGSLFTVTLPLLLQDANQDKLPNAWIGARCLIVDDDRQNCENAAELLKDMGLCPLYVTSGTEAVTLVESPEHKDSPFGLIIVDWKMPGLNGMETVRRIRREIRPEVPVIMVTAYDWPEIEKDAREAGVTAFLSKPLYRSKITYLLCELSRKELPEKIQDMDSCLPDYTGKRILLVEDNDLNREIARELIADTGIQTKEACDGQEAVRMVSEAPEGYYDLILMDIQMPVMNGYEATKRIRGLNRADTQKLPIIAMTANAFEEDVRAAKRAGMDAHFSKPIDMDQFHKMLKQFLTKGAKGNS